MLKRTLYLINPEFQLRFCFFVASLIFISSLVYPFTIYDLIEKLVALSNNQEIINTLNTNKTKLIISLAIYQLIFITLVFIICIFQGHKIAGPLYKLKTSLNKLSDGKFPGKLQFRKGDHFQDLADSFNTAVEKVQNTYHNDFAYISEVCSYLHNLALVVPEDKKDILMQIIKNLQEIQERFKQA